MSNSGCRTSKRRPLVGILGTTALLLCHLGPVWAANQESEPARDRIKDERVELFLALLKRRAQQILEARRPPPPPFLSVSSGLSQGYESNVNLDGDKRGDFFTEETLGVVLRPRVTSWLRGQLTYDLLNTHFAALRDTNLWVNTLEGVVQIQPHDRVRVDLGYEYSIVNFPFDTNSSFFDQRARVQLRLAQTSWLTHRSTWTYQLRDYDTRKARDADRVGILGVNREDQRHIVSQELLFRFPQTSVRVGGRFYRNFSNEVFQNFYDWEDYQVRGVLVRVFNPKWIGVLVHSYERKNYQERNVPNTATAERDDLLTFAASLIYQLSPTADLTYSLTYRHQDSNDPRLDFIDMVNELNLSVSF